MAKNKGKSVSGQPAVSLKPEPSPLAWTSKGLQIQLHVKPNAKAGEVLGVQDDKIHVSVTSPPHDGQANRGVIEVMSSALGLRKGDLSIVAGQKSRDKVLLCSSSDEALLETIKDKLAKLERP
ncbi:hypothetical protein M422DRAFT_258835 [Sphaerobolus stellatus SS14]|uniref:Uncharacterized protein n=1 Tax=Sphaerobolus stellatus (strain SS14) TaxID=990650 RepID=A0A0C9VAA3_SPHS4|nr:hypothetical protein M422DRAFT_274867 [Sphaerobolus stellatus SS14]KIJ38467.1 hypothetical protein M422DRAFT_258835 [Sphaerobolus stellatus SS14]